MAEDKKKKKLNSAVIEKSCVIDERVWHEGNTLAVRIKKMIFAALMQISAGKIELDPGIVKLSHPTLENYGDFTTNVAFLVAGKLGMKPQELAKKLEETLNKYIQTNQTITYLTYSKTSSDITDGGNDTRIKPQDILERAEVAGVGFLNLWLQKGYLSTSASSVLNSDNGVITSCMKGKKIAVEYTDPNPFKEFHLGHLYSNVIGESIARLFEACGAQVWRGDFYGDVGMHVAKSLYGLLAKLKIKNEKLKILHGENYIKELRTEIEKLEKLSIADRQKFLGEGYAIGVKKFEEDESAAEEVKDINYLIYVASQEILKKKKGWKPIVDYRQYVKGRENRLEEISTVYEAGLRWSLEYFESIYKILGTKFDGYYPESWVGEYGMKIVEKGLKMGILEKNDGAIIYKGEQDGYHTRVFVNKLGLPTYEAKDLGLAYAKYQDFPYDLSLNIFGREIDEYYKVVRAAMRKIEPELGKKANYIAHGMVKLPQGKMSSRTGNVVTFEWLTNEAKKYALNIMKDVDLESSEKERVADIVGIGAIRFALLKSSFGNDVVFDFEKSITFEGDSGPYLQYTYARCRSVLRKAKNNATMQPCNNDTKNGKLEHCNIVTLEHYNDEELSLLRTIYKFPEIVGEAARNISPSMVCEYLFDLSQKYNLFYGKHSILGQAKNIEHRTYNKEQITDNKKQINPQPTTNFRLMLTAAVSSIIQKGLNILGIETVERM